MELHLRDWHLASIDLESVVSDLHLRVSSGEEADLGVRVVEVTLGLLPFFSSVNETVRSPRSQA